MNMEYKEPMFKVVIASKQDVLTASAEAAPVYNPGQFESEEISFGI